MSHANGENVPTPFGSCRPTSVVHIRHQESPVLTKAADGSPRSGRSARRPMHAIQGSRRASPKRSSVHLSSVCGFALTPRLKGLLALTLAAAAASAMVIVNTVVIVRNLPGFWPTGGGDHAGKLWGRLDAGGAGLCAPPRPNEPPAGLGILAVLATHLVKIPPPYLVRKLP